MTIPTTLPKGSAPGDAARGWWNEVRANRRAQLGLILITVLIAGYGLSLLRGATIRSEASYQRDAQKLARLVATEAERDWPQRAKASAALRSDLDQRLWTAESEGVAQANLQALIASVGREIGLPMFDIRIEAAKLKNLPPELRQITATITAQPSETAVIALLERLDRAPHLTVVARLHIHEQPNPMLELVLVGYARITGAEPGSPK
jgi:hypothetical protein